MAIRVIRQWGLEVGKEGHKVTPYAICTISSAGWAWAGPLTYKQGSTVWGVWGLASAYLSRTVEDVWQVGGRRVLFAHIYDNGLFGFELDLGPPNAQVQEYLRDYCALFQTLVRAGAIR